MRQFGLSPRGPFSLVASSRFLEGFTPAGRTPGDGQSLRLAFVADTAFSAPAAERTAGVALRTEGDTVIGEVSGEAPVEVVRAQVARILSLDVDGEGFPA